MKRLLSLVLLASPAFAGWSWCVPVTFNNHPASTLTDYPAMFCANGSTGAFCDSVAHSNLVLGILKTVGNGGAVTSASGYDIGWFSDAACTSSVPFQLIPGVYAAATGLVEMRVKISSFSSSVDTVMYMGVGNSAITTDQSSTSTWPSTFKRVYPLPNGASLDANDATSGAHNGTASGDGFADTAQLDGGFTSNNTGIITTADTGLPSGSSSRTVTYWYNGAGLGLTGGTNIALSYGTISGTFGQWFAPNIIRSCISCCGSGDNKGTFGFYGWGADTVGTTAYCIPANGTPLYHLAYTYDGTTMSTYVNGVLDKATAVALNTVLSGNMVIVGSNQAFSQCQSCKIDQLEIADTVLSTAWITADYNNGSAPWSFYTIGTPVAPGGSAPRRVVTFQ